MKYSYRFILIVLFISDSEGGNSETSNSDEDSDGLEIRNASWKSQLLRLYFFSKIRIWRSSILGAFISEFKTLEKIVKFSQRKHQKQDCWLPAT